MYQNVVALRSDTHHETCVRTGTSFHFAARLNSVPLLATEFGDAAAEFPIVFVEEKDTVTPVAVTGLREGENAFVDELGNWTGRYVPAFLRRYPFVGVQGSEDTMTLCLDADFEGVNTEGRGERLFDADGNRTDYLTRMLGFASEFQRHAARTQAFCDRLKRLDLLEPAQARVAPAGQPERAVTGFRAIRRERLRALADDDLRDMLQGGELEWCFQHLVSLGTIGRLIRSAPDPDAEARTRSRTEDAEPTA